MVSNGSKGEIQVVAARFVNILPPPSVSSVNSNDNLF